MIRFILGALAGASAVYAYALLLSYTREEKPDVRTISSLPVGSIVVNLWDDPNGADTRTVH